MIGKFVIPRFRIRTFFSLCILLVTATPVHAVAERLPITRMGFTARALLSRMEPTLVARVATLCRRPTHVLPRQRILGSNLGFALFSGLGFSTLIPVAEGLIEDPGLATPSAELKVLTSLFEVSYNQLYVHRECGKNVGRLIKEAKRLNIDLSNSYVLKIEGSDFLEVSAFYTRNHINERQMLGYFHFVLVAQGYVFDFDLDKPLVLPIEEYVRLQFTPPTLPYQFMGIDMNPRKYLPEWKVEGYSIDSYLGGQPQLLWTKKMNELINIERTLNQAM